MIRSADLDGSQMSFGFFAPHHFTKIEEAENAASLIPHGALTTKKMTVGF